jgi:hypothetical protein
MVHFYAPGTGSAFTIRIRIRDECGSRRIRIHKLTAKKKKISASKPKIQVSAARYKHFKALLYQCIMECYQVQGPKIDDIRKFIAENEKNDPFTEEELDVVLNMMQDEGLVYRSGETVNLI